MDRLALINTTRTVPMTLYDSDDLPEVRMRKILLGYRFRAEVGSTDGAPEQFFRWVHLDEWREHHDKPCLHNYGSVTEVMSSRDPNYCLIQFLHPEIYFKLTKFSPRIALPKLGTKTLQIRWFNRTYVDFLTKTEAAFLNSWIDKLLDDNEEYIATYDGEGPTLVPLESERFRNHNLDIVIEDCLLPPRKRPRSLESELFSSDTSDDESSSPSPLLSPPTDPRLVDLTHE